MDPSKMTAQLSERLDPDQLAFRIGNPDLLMLEHPSIGVWYEDGIQTGCERWIDVGFGTIADHPGVIFIDLVFARDLLVGRWALLHDDFNRVEEWFQARALDLALLLGRLAFGDENQVMPRREILQGFRNPLDQLHWMLRDLVGEAVNGFLECRCQGL